MNKKTTTLVERDRTTQPSMTLLTVPEARAILIADEALQISYDARLAAGQTFGIEELSAWAHLVKSALDRVAAFGERRVEQVMTVLACREGSSWVVQAIEEDVASQGESLLGALVDLGRMFDARDQLIADSAEPIAANPRAPVEYEHALDKGHYVGVLPLGAVRVAQIYIGISPFEKRTP